MNICWHASGWLTLPRDEVKAAKKLVSLLDLCVSSLRRGHANLLCIVPIMTDDPRKESKVIKGPGFQDLHTHRWVSALAHAGK